MGKDGALPGRRYGHAKGRGFGPGSKQEINLKRRYFLACAAGIIRTLSSSTNSKAR